MIAQVLVLLSSTSQADSHSWGADVKSLQIENGAGDIEISASGTTIEVQTELQEGDCIVEFGDSGGASVKIRPVKKRGECSMDVHVTLPADTKLTLELGAGDVEIDGLRGSAIIQVGAGDLELDVGALKADVGAGDVEGTVVGAAAVQVGAGNVDLDGLSHPIEVVLGAGGVELSFDKAPEGLIEVAAGVGSVEIDLPDDTVIDSDLPKSSRNELKTNKGAATRVDIAAGLGHVRVE